MTYKLPKIMQYKIFFYNTCKILIFLTFIYDIL